jgi:uncharacterized damage-inducible protein DinB
MSEQAHIQTLFSYHWAVTDQLLAGVMKLSAEDQGAPHHTLFHLLRVDNSWRTGLETGKQPSPPLAIEDFPTLESLSAGFAEERRAWGALLESLDDAAIGAEMLITVRWLNSGPTPLARWRMIHQVLMHGMQHHAELAQLLTDKGLSPGNIDFIFHQA